MLQSLIFPKTIFLYILSFFCAAVLTSCGNSDEPAPPEPQPTTRTILVYMAANCNLGYQGYDAADLAEMLRGAQEGALSGGRLIVYHAGYRSVPILKEVTADSIIELKSYPESEVSSLDISRMRQVIADTRSIAPADSYGIIFWSHGTTWRETTTARSADGGSPGSRSHSDHAGDEETSTPPVSYSYGNDNGIEMKITSLATALEGYRFDFIYFDVCHMATVEVAYELRHAAPVLIGSTTELDVLGMPYHLNLAPLFAPVPDVTGAARNTLEYYIPLQRSGCTMSVINLDAMDDLSEATRAIYLSGATLPPDYAAIPYYKVSRPCLVYDFGHYIRALDAAPELAAAWEDAYARTIVYKDTTPVSWTFDMKEFTGLGSFILFYPSDASTDGYSAQSWYKDVARYAFPE